MNENMLKKCELHTFGNKGNYMCILYYKGVEKKRLDHIKVNTLNEAYKKAVKVLNLVEKK